MAAPNISKKLLLIILFLNAGKVLAAERCPYPGTELEKAILSELNVARQNPAAYAKRLEALEPLFVGKERKLGERSFLVTQEGVSVVKEAVRELEHTPPRPALRWNPSLSASAAEHVRDNGPRGLLGHESSHGERFRDRILRYYNYRAAGEAISYGPQRAEQTIEELLVDDGVPDRGHRYTLLDPGFEEVGVACGPHTKFGTFCVLDFASPMRK